MNARSRESRTPSRRPVASRPPTASGLRAALAVAAGIACTATLAVGSQAAAQERDHAAGHHEVEMPAAGFRAELIGDIDRLEQKYVALAEALRGKYEWRPGEGVRSVSEVFMHVAGANFMLPTFVGIDPPEHLEAGSMETIMATLQELERVTDAAEVAETLGHSFTHARHAIARTPDAELDAKIDLFGREATKRAALDLLVNHMHEHLGQAVAYARVNGVVPPWSEGAASGL